MLTALHVGVLTATILLLSRVVGGVHIKNAPAAVVTAVLFGILNWGLGWLIGLLLVVPAIFTFGLLFLLFPFIINTVILWLTDAIVGAFEIDDIRSLLLSSGAITLVNGAFHLLVHR